jgi:hypothetical protein
MDLLGSIMGSMDKPPTASEREKKMKKALQEKAEKRLEAEQKRRAKFRTEVEEKVKELLSDGDKKELPFPKVPKVYRAILHDVADAAGLFSHSVGDGDEKDVIITKEPHTSDVSIKKTQSTTGIKDGGASSLPPTRTDETTPTATPPSSDYREKYRHLIGGLECAEKTAVKMEPNRTFGYGQSYMHLMRKLLFWNREM